MVKKIKYLAGLTIGPSFYDSKALQKDITNIIAMRQIAELDGLEIRLKGEVSGSKITSGPKPSQVWELCNTVRDYYDIINLHLSSFGLTTICGKYEKGVDNMELLEQFNLIVGHYGKHENLFGEAVANNYLKILEGTRYSTKKVFWRSLSNIFADGQLPPGLQKKFLIENGSRSYNCLPRVYEYARSHDLSIALDIGHFILGTLERDEKTNVPCDGLYKYIKRDASGSPTFKTNYLNELGSKATHLHIHGVQVRHGEYKDHVVLSTDTIRGLQVGMISRLLGNAAVNSATVELHPEYQTPENISKTIKNFESMFMQ